MLVQVIQLYREALSRILFLDYDGTLVNFTGIPAEAITGPGIHAILWPLASDPKNTVVIISGRDMHFLESQFNGLPVNLIAEHGYLLKRAGKQPEIIYPGDHSWKGPLGRDLRKLSSTMPGSFIEEKEASIAFHFRNMSPVFMERAVTEVRKRFRMITARVKGLEVLYGNRIIEIKSGEFTKGSAARIFIGNNHYDFILAAGDDITDESLFHELRQEAVTIKVGQGETVAKYCIGKPSELLELLGELSNEQ